MTNDEHLRQEIVDIVNKVEYCYPEQVETACNKILALITRERQKAVEEALSIAILKIGEATWKEADDYFQARRIIREAVFPMMFPNPSDGE